MRRPAFALLRLLPLISARCYCALFELQLNMVKASRERVLLRGFMAIAGTAANLMDTITDGIVLHSFWQNGQPGFFAAVLVAILFGAFFHTATDFVYRRPNWLHLLNITFTRSIWELWERLRLEFALCRVDRGGKGAHAVTVRVAPAPSSAQQGIPDSPGAVAAAGPTAVVPIQTPASQEDHQFATAVSLRRSMDQCHCVNITSGVGEGIPSSLIQLYALLRYGGSTSSQAFNIVSIAFSVLGAAHACGLWWRSLRPPFTINALFACKVILTAVSRALVLVGFAMAWEAWALVYWYGSMCLGLPLVLWCRAQVVKAGAVPVPSDLRERFADKFILVGTLCFLGSFAGFPFTWSLRARDWWQNFVIFDTKILLENIVLVPILLTFIPADRMTDAARTGLAVAAVAALVLHLVLLYFLRKVPRSMEEGGSADAGVILYFQLKYPRHSQWPLPLTLD